MKASGMTFRLGRMSWCTWRMSLVRGLVLGALALVLMPREAGATTVSDRASSYIGGIYQGLSALVRSGRSLDDIEVKDLDEVLQVERMDRIAEGHYHARIMLLGSKGPVAGSGRVVAITTQTLRDPNANREGMWRLVVMQSMQDQRLYVDRLKEASAAELFRNWGRPLPNVGVWKRPYLVDDMSTDGMVRSLCAGFVWLVAGVGGFMMVGTVWRAMVRRWGE